MHACTKDDVIWEILEGGTTRAVRKDVLVCLVFDMCRNKARDISAAHHQGEIQDTGFERKQEIKKLGFNDQILIVSSTLLGETASDTNSFTLRLTRAMRNLPVGEGIRILELEHLKCQLEGGFSTKPTRQSIRSFFYIKFDSSDKSIDL